MSLQRLLFLMVAALMIAAVLPGGLAVERRISAELVRRSHDDVGRMPRMLAARQASAADAMMMYAKELAAAPGLADAVARGDRAAAMRILESARGSLGHLGVLVTREGPWMGPHPGDDAVRATMGGKMPVTIRTDGDRVHTIGVSPIMEGSRWIGAAGYAVTLDSAEAGMLSGLTRSDVIVRTASGGIAATTLPREQAASLLESLGPGLATGAVHEVVAGGRRLHVAPGAAGTDATVFFIRDLDSELAIVPRIRRLALLISGIALLAALVLGALLASALARPAQTLARAADDLAAGNFDAPIGSSRVYEFDRMGHAFTSMRLALARRVRELETANRELADRQRRLAELQGELLQRDRLATAGRLVSQLAHEIRNPVANVRNCLELIRRRASLDDEGRQLTELATDELLRMHELAERVLDLHRPSLRADSVCDVATVADDVAALTRLGASPALRVRCIGERTLLASIAPDALKQVLLVIVQNARDAMQDTGTIEIAARAEGGGAAIEVTDSGPGIPADVLPHIFDPFFTTKGGVQGVGLGLFVAEGIVRSHGGRLVASNPARGGALFRIELQPATLALTASVLESQQRTLS